MSTDSTAAIQPLTILNTVADTLLDDKYEAIDDNAGLIDVVLYPHQQTVIKALITLEAAHCRTLGNKEYLSNIIVLRDPFGSGKTLEILGLINTVRVPPAKPEYFSTQGAPYEQASRNTIIERCIGNSRINLTMIVVGVSVMCQWMDAIKRFTKLKCFPIGDIHGLKKFITAYNNGSIMRYHIVLVKNGIISGSLDDCKFNMQFCPNNIRLITNHAELRTATQSSCREYNCGVDESDLTAPTASTTPTAPTASTRSVSVKERSDFCEPSAPSAVRALYPRNLDKTNKSLVCLIGDITANRIWTRVVYDDYDTINLHPDAVVIKALSTIIVSATNRISGYRNEHDNVTIGHRLTYHGMYLSSITKVNDLYSCFSIKCLPKYVEESTHITIINHYLCVYDNQDDNYIRLISAFGDADINNIMEMLNGDAVEDAATALGIRTTSVADIFKRVLDNKYDEYDKASKAITAAKTTLYLHRERPSGYDSEHARIPSEDTIKTYLNEIRAGNACNNIEWHWPQITTAIGVLMTDLVNERDRAMIAIQRVIDNLREGDCIVCIAPLADDSCFLMRCCGAILCSECGVKSTRIAKRYDYVAKQYTLNGSCPKCSKVIYPERDLIYVDREFDMDKIIAGATADNIAELDPPVVEDEPTPDVSTDNPYNDIKNPKIRAIVDIVTGGIPSCRKVKEYKYGGMIIGNTDKPQLPTTPNKTVVFVSYETTTKKIIDTFAQYNIEFLRLGGGFREIANTIEEFRNGTATVLLINSKQHCAGTNIQFATNFVSYGTVLDSQVMGQMVGRCQRIGRTCNLNIYRLRYQNEADS